MKPSNLARDTLLLLRRGLTVSLRAPVSAFIFPVAFPLLTMIFVSQLTARITSLPIFPYHPYIAYLAPGTLLLVPMIGAGYAATGLVVDANSGFLDRIRLLPTRTAAILLAKLAFEAIRVLPAGIIMLAVSVALGADADHGLVTVFGVLGLIVVWSMAYSGLFYFVGLRTLSAQAPIALLPLALPVLFSSTALVPPALMPGWLSTVANWNPYSYLVGGARTLMIGTPVDLAAIGKAVAVAAAILVITQLLVLSAFRRLARAT
jgi:ABC-2 type transport system permease protein